jgi:hypothetical protein
MAPRKIDPNFIGPMQFRPRDAKRVEINGRMQTLFRRIQAEDSELTAEIRRIIEEEAEGLMRAIEANLRAVGGVDTGELLRSIAVDIGGKGLSAEVGAGAGMKDIRNKQWMNTLALWIEHGTRPHALGEGSSLRVSKRDFKAGKAAIQEGRMHPGTRPRPFVKPAYEVRRPRIVRRLEEAAVRVLDQFSTSAVKIKPEKPKPQEWPGLGGSSSKPAGGTPE